MLSLIGQKLNPLSNDPQPHPITNPMKTEDELQKAYEIIGNFIMIQHKKHEQCTLLFESLVNVLKVCKSPTLTAHGLAHVEKALALVDKLQKEYEY